jgi:hypothetical protein
MAGPDTQVGQLLHLRGQDSWLQTAEAAAARQETMLKLPEGRMEPWAECHQDTQHRHCMELAISRPSFILDLVVAALLGMAVVAQAVAP